MMRSLGFHLEPQHEVVLGRVQKLFTSINESSVIADLISRADASGQASEVLDVLQKAADECDLLSDAEKARPSVRLEVLVRHCQQKIRSWG